VASPKKPRPKKGGGLASLSRTALRKKLLETVTIRTVLGRRTGRSTVLPDRDAGEDTRGVREAGARVSGGRPVATVGYERVFALRCLRTMPARGGRAADAGE